MNTRNYLLETIDDFAHLVKSEIKNFLPEEFENADIEICEKQKNNGVKLYGLRIQKCGETITPIVYINKFWREYKDTPCIDCVLKSIAEERLNAEIDNFEEIPDFTSWPKIKDRIIARVINKEWNDHILEGIPHTVIGCSDLAAVYYFTVTTGNDLIGSVQISNEMMHMWGLDAADIHAQAVKNIKSAGEVTFQGMLETLAELAPESVDWLEEETASEYATDPLYVLTTKDRVNGARALLNTDIMDAIFRMFNGSFYIIPSSIHEVLIVNKKLADGQKMSADAIVHIIDEVNTNQVPIEDRLSGNLYSWDPVLGLHIVND